MKVAIIYLLAITGAEAITAFFTPMWGMLCHIVILVAVILHSALTKGYPHRQLILSLALVPLVRIISLSMPLVNIPQIWWYPIIYIPLLVAAIMAMRILGYRAEQVGLNFKRFPIQLAIMLTGFGFGIAEYYILVKLPTEPLAVLLKLSTEPLVVPLIAEFTWQEIWLPALIFLMCTGFVEELIFRGVLQRSALEAFGKWGIVYVSLLFAVLHMGFLSWIDVIFVFAVALFFGWVVNKTGSLIGVTLAHGITNTVLYLIAPFFF